MGKYDCDKCNRTLAHSTWTLCDDCQTEEKEADERIHFQFEQQQEESRAEIARLQARCERLERALRQTLDNAVPVACVHDGGAYIVRLTTREWAKILNTTAIARAALADEKETTNGHG